MDLSLASMSAHATVAPAQLHVPALGSLGLLRLRIATPLLLAVMSRFMLEVPESVVRANDIPRAALRQAYRRNPAHRQKVHACLAKVGELSDELGLRVWPFDSLWSRVGIAPRRS